MSFDNPKSAPPKLQGWLKKLKTNSRNPLSNWNKRWFAIEKRTSGHEFSDKILMGACFCADCGSEFRFNYYVDPRQPRPVQSIDLYHLTDVRPFQIANSSIKHPYAFQVDSQVKSFVLRAHSSIEMEAWISGLKRFMELAASQMAESSQRKKGPYDFSEFGDLNDKVEIQVSQEFIRATDEEDPDSTSSENHDVRDCRDAEEKKAVANCVLSQLCASSEPSLASRLLPQSVQAQLVPQPPYASPSESANHLRPGAGQPDSSKPGDLSHPELFDGVALSDAPEASSLDLDLSSESEDTSRTRAAPRSNASQFETRGDSPDDDQVSSRTITQVRAPSPTHGDGLGEDEPRSSSSTQPRERAIRPMQLPRGDWSDSDGSDVEEAEDEGDGAVTARVSQSRSLSRSSQSSRRPSAAPLAPTAFHNQPIAPSSPSHAWQPDLSDFQGSRSHSSRSTSRSSYNQPSLPTMGLSARSGVNKPSARHEASPGFRPIEQVPVMHRGVSNQRRTPSPSWSRNSGFCRVPDALELDLSDDESPVRSQCVQTSMDDTAMSYRNSVGTIRPSQVSAPEANPSKQAAAVSEQPAVRRAVGLAADPNWLEDDWDD